MARLAWFLAIICSLARVSCRIESVMCGDVKMKVGGYIGREGGVFVKMEYACFCCV